MSHFDPYAHLGIVLNPDGTITRLINPTIEAKHEPSPGDSFVTQDKIINSDTNVWVRIYRPTKLPSNDNAVARLPVIMYFHGGGFVLHSAAGQTSHDCCAKFSVELPAIVISVNYRLAPEHRLPAPYHDAEDAILWLKDQILHSEGDQWLRNYADYTRFYLAGRGSGGNIVFSAGLKAAKLDLNPIRLCGLILNQPMFGGVQRTKSELALATDQLLPLPVLDLLWELTLPKGTDRDHLYCNPMAEGPHRKNVALLTRFLVIGFRDDPLYDRMQELVEMMASEGVQIEAWFDDLGFHNIDTIDERRATIVLNMIKKFVI